MNKVEFVDAVAGKTGLTKKDTKIAVDAFLEIIQESLSQGNSVQFVGFGTFMVADRAERKARIPGTGEQITVPAGKAVRFKVGKELKNSLKGE